MCEIEGHRQDRVRFVSAANAVSWTVSVTLRSSLLSLLELSVKASAPDANGGGRAAARSFTRAPIPPAAAIRVLFCGSNANAPSARHACVSTAGCQANVIQLMTTTIPFA